MRLLVNRHSRAETCISFLLAGLLIFFVYGKFSILAAAWLAPLFLLRFLRTMRPIPGLLAAFLLANAAFFVSFRGVIPLPANIFIAVTPLFALYLLLPYLADRLLAPRIRGFASTFVFPLAFTLGDYINSLSNPFGTWGSLAYSQYGNLPLLQVLQVTGIWGVIFIVSWFSSVLNWAWEHRAERSVVRKPMFWYAGTMTAMILVGSIVMLVQPSGAPTVRIASLSVASPEFKAINRKIEDNQMSQSDWDDARIVTRNLQDALLAKTEREAKAGAKIVFWSEANGEVIEGDEEAFVKRGQALAKSLQIYLAMSVEVFKPDGIGKHENKLIWITPQGEVQDTYYKTILIPGFEDSHYVNGDGAHHVETPYGTIGLSICFDADFPSVVRRNGKNGVDIQLLPSGDWRAIAPLHTYMASFRAIENGYSLIRQARDGLSAAYDPNGRLLAQMDYFTTEDKVMISQVPTKGHSTFYAKTGDWFAWLSAIGLIYCMGAAYRKPARRRGNNGPSLPTQA